MESLYTKKELLTALKDAGLPYSYPTLIRYEKKGLIDRPKNEMKYKDRSWRIYSEEEILTIVKIIKNNVNSKKHSQIIQEEQLV